MKRCVICNRHQGWGRGKTLVYLYDKDTDDYHCMECDTLVRQLVKEMDARENRRLQYIVAGNTPDKPNWIVETEKFIETLDFSLDDLDQYE